MKLFLALFLVATSAMAQEQSPIVCPPCPEGMICTPKPVEPPVNPGGVKWHPGHYSETQTYGSIPQSVINDIARVPAIRGVTQRHNWSQLEPTKGNYDFSSIEADLAKLRPHGKHLVVLLMDRSWSDPKNRSHLPAYLGSGILPHPLYGAYAAIWRPSVMDRLIALSEAMAKRFDNDPNFEGIRFEEITLGLASGSADYTNAKLIAEWIRLAKASRWHWKRTNVFFNTNTLGGVEGPLKITETAYQVGIGVGGPDVIPPGAGDYQIAGDRVIQRKPEPGDDPSKFIRDYRGQIPISHSVQTPSLGGKEGTFYPKTLADYAILQQGETHMSWVVAPSTVKVNWKSHILPYLSGAPRGTVQTCPKRYVACVTE